MKAFFCDCGNRVFFDNDRCLACQRALGFDADRLTMVTLTESENGDLEAADGRPFRRCANYRDYGNCNWLIAADSAESLCGSCRLNDLVPGLDSADTIKLWTRVEQAKRRLLYSLRALELPLAGDRPLRFRILEDRRRNPDVLESFVATAHLDGTITLNIAEADDAVRHAVREQMQERYRTMLGHLRHEIGHYYFGRLVDTPELLAECRERFGDERSDYASALTRHYDAGPPPNWPDRFVSAYASAHPAEDFAETFAHFLHIDDALETARTAGLATGDSPGRQVGDDWISDWISLSITLNEILRSLGADDPYPFVLAPPVQAKLEFIDRLVRRRAAPPDG